MSSLLAYAAPLALVVPMIGQGPDAGWPGVPQGAVMADETRLDAGPDVGREQVASGVPRGHAPDLLSGESMPEAEPLAAFYERQRAHQVRIEQRVVIRITPQRPAARQQLLATLPREEIATRFEERKMDKCVAVESIAGVQTGSANRLVLFLKDKRIVTANLEKTCRARDFYSGFYLERNEDGKLCVQRDKLKSRTGVKCEVERMRQLVAVKDEG